MPRISLLLTAAALMAGLAACNEYPADSLELESPQTQLPPPVGKKGVFKIVEMMPDPWDEDDYAEWFRVKNVGDTAVAPAGWKIVDAEGTTWTMDEAGKQEIGAVFKITSPYVAKLANTGDTVRVISPTGETVQTVIYGPVEEGTIIKP